MHWFHTTSVFLGKWLVHCTDCWGWRGYESLQRWVCKSKQIHSGAVSPELLFMWMWVPCDYLRAVMNNHQVHWINCCIVPLILIKTSSSFSVVVKKKERTCPPLLNKTHYVCSEWFKTWTCCDLNDVDSCCFKYH